jgi:hypothetical protein
MGIGSTADRETSSRQARPSFCEQKEAKKLLIPWSPAQPPGLQGVKLFARFFPKKRCLLA